MDKNKGYRAVEKSAAEWAKQTQARTDIDQDTKNNIVLEQSRQLDELRKSLGTKE